MPARFRGEYRHTIDKKGRMSVPAKFREALGEKFVFSKGPDRCLMVYPLEEWETIEDKVYNNENFTKAAGRAFIRQMFPSADDGEIDAMGRTLVPASLREYAGFTDKMEVVILGVANRLEIWAADRWDEYCSENADAMDISAGMEMFEI